MERADVVIVGAGAVGLAAAWRLAERGADVVVLERFHLGHDRGSSHGATRIFRFAYDDPTYVDLAQRALPLWRALEEKGGGELVHITGGLDIGDDVTLEATSRALADGGAAVEQLGPGALRDRFIWLDAGERRGVYSPDTGVIAAAEAIDALARAARDAGARIMELTPCDGISAGSDRVEVDAPGEPIEARRVVIAAGAWADGLLAPLGIRVPLRVTREQVFYFAGGDALIPFIDHGSVTRYGVPSFAGAAGAKVAEHGTGRQTTAESRSFEIEADAAERLTAYVARTLPALDPEPLASETCLYTTTPDDGFVLGARGPIVIASACSGHGFKFAPIVGEIVADIVDDGESVIPLGPFSLDRFA